MTKVILPLYNYMYTYIPVIIIVSPFKNKIMWYMEHGHSWGMHWIWWILWVIFLIWIFVTPWNVPGQKTNKETPLDILKKRYAAGEIDSEEFEERKKTLMNN